MHFSYDRYFKADPMSNTTTWSKDLPETGILSDIILRFTMVNGSGIQNANKARIIDHITKIEITNGGTEKMLSLTGQELRAFNFYFQKEVMPETAILYGNKTQRSLLLIPFGRFFKDPDFMLDLAAWDEVCLEITNDLTATQCDDKKCNVDVQLLYANELSTVPGEYMKYYEWKNEKPSADGQYVTQNMPTTDLIAMLMVQVEPDLESTGEPTNDPVSDNYNLTMTYKEKKEYIWDHRPKDIMRENSLVYGSPVTDGRYFASASQYMDLAIAYVTNAQFGWTTDASPANTDYLEATESNFRFQVAAGVAGVNFADVRAKGDGYYHTMVLHDARLTGSENYLNPSKEAEGKGPVRLEWYGYRDDHTFRTCLASPVAQGET